MKKFTLLSILLLSLTLLCGCVTHQHTFEDEWTADQNNHYYKSTCGHDVVDSLGSHTFGSGEQEGENTYYTCTVCGYVKVEGPHIHTYDDKWSKDDTHHWKEANCGHDAVDQRGEHNFDTGVANSDNTEIVFTCQICSYEKTEQVIVHECTFEGEWLQKKPATIFEEGILYRTCTDEECNLEQTKPLARVEVISLQLTSLPSKLVYLEGEQFDSTGIKVIAVGEDESQNDVTNLVTYDKTTLSKGDTFVEVSFASRRCFVEIVVETQQDRQKISVSQAKKQGVNDDFVLVEGYFVGVADEGYNLSKEILLKDTTTDDVIAVRGVTDSYGTWPNIGYKYGDKVRLYGKLVQLTYTSDDKTSQNKIYLDFDSQQNPQNIIDTIVSQNNAVSYNFDQIVDLTDWKDWQKTFNPESIEAYTYIKISGKVFLNSFTGNDNVVIHRVHANAGATTLVNIKPDAARAAGFRQNVLEQNIGDDWRNLFSYQQDSVSKIYPGDDVNVEIVAIVTATNSVNYQLTVLRRDWVVTNPTSFEYTNQQVVTEVAYAFFRQGTQSEYDMTKGRRDFNSSPEDATADDALVLDCSSYANTVYYEAFGESIIKGQDGSSTATLTSYAKANLGKKSDVVGYWETADYTTEEDRQALLQQVKDMLEVGDCIVYRHGKTEPTGGHVMVYVGNGLLLHSTGTSYTYASDATKSYDKATKDEHNIGTVQTMSVDVLFKQDSKFAKRYLFYTTASDSTFNFSLLRPLNRNLKPTAKTQNRMDMQGLDMEKSVSVGAYSSIYNNSTVTYNVRLTNTSSVDLTNLRYSETLGMYSSFVSSDTGVSASGKLISWMGDVAANSTVSISYVVKVATTDRQAVVESKSNVNGVRLNTIYNTISHYTKEQMQLVASKALQYGNGGAGFTNPIEFVKDVYKKTLGVDLTSNTGVGATLDELIDVDNKTCKNDTDLSKMIAPHLYGGLDIYSGYTKDKLRVRLVEKANLAIGDVILAEYDGKSMSAIYLGDGKLVAIYSETDVCEVVDVGDEEYRLSGSYYILDTVLAQLISYDRYAVLRPSFV